MPLVVPGKLHPQMIVKWMKTTPQSTGTLLYPVDFSVEVFNTEFLLWLHSPHTLFSISIILEKMSSSKEDNKKMNAGDYLYLPEIIFWRVFQASASIRRPSLIGSTVE